ncbi:peptidylprolyl isomerase [Balneolaceae bacterium ANBcel3]|nr:peptidylprolyl isomerase [Balneolaceae bacterium ANBcel3]
MRISLIFSLFLLLSTSVYAQNRQVADQIVAVVNDNVILKSDIDQQLFQFMQQSQMSDFDERLWYYVLESVIDNYVLLEKAKIDSIVVSDAEVDRVLSQRISMLTEQVGGERELERAFGMPLIEIREQYADQFREDMIVNQVRQKKIQNIQITRPEVVDFYNSIPTDSLPIIPESVSLSQITIIPPPKPDARENARRLATQLRDSIVVYDIPLSELAQRHSEGPTASQGGTLPMVETTDLLPEYAAAAAALEPGGISEVVDTPQGFHIIRLNERQGQNIATSHILITVGDEELDTEFAVNKLTALRDSILHHNKRFADMARRYSDDKNTSPSGGRLLDPQTGQRYLAVSDLQPSLHRVVLLLDEEGDISEPRSYTYGPNEKTAYRIVRLNERIPEHRANLDQDFQMIRNFALQQKRQEKVDQWIQDLRKEMYVEYRIDVPDLSDEVPDFLAPELHDPVEEDMF